VVYFHGGGSQKDLHLDFVATGVACFAMDVRGQGGTSVDRGVYHSGDVNGGLMTRGVLDKEEFYMRNIYMDAIRAMDVVAQLEEVDPERIVTFGGSQGGALSVVASGLSGRSKKAYVNEPSYCCLKQRTLLGTGVFGATNGYLRKYPENTDRVFEMLSYFDVVNMASFLKVPSFFCIGLADEVCLPHFVYSAYAQVPGPKEMYICPFINHTIVPSFAKLVHGEVAQL